MYKKLLIFVLVIFVFCTTGTIFAQSKQTAASLISRAESLADRMERLAERTKTMPTTTAGQNELKRISRDLEDDSATLSNDIAFANLTDVPFTDQQQNRLMNAIRRYTNALSQTQRNISRWNQ